MLNCYIDCTMDEKFLTLGLWGKPVLTYPVYAVIESGCFEKVCLVTKSRYIEYLINELQIPVRVVCEKKEEGVTIDGRTAVITSRTIKEIICSHVMHNNFCLNDYITDTAEKVIVDSLLTFELALCLVRKKERKTWLRKAVLKRIEEKWNILKNADKHEICLLGHSQFDEWNIKNLNNVSVRNCGISGITINEYMMDILKSGKMNLSSEKIIILLGTNDIVLEQTVDDIVLDYCKLIDYIASKTDSEIILLESLHVSGRLDRNNNSIDELNRKIQINYADRLKIISTSDMNDDFGNLNFKYTVDGLHLNVAGYMKLTEILEEGLR